MRGPLEGLEDMETRRTIHTWAGRRRSSHQGEDPYNRVQNHLGHGKWAHVSQALTFLTEGGPRFGPMWHFDTPLQNKIGNLPKD